MQHQIDCEHVHMQHQIDCEHVHVQHQIDCEHVHMHMLGRRRRDERRTGMRRSTAIPRLIPKWEKTRKSTTRITSRTCTDLKICTLPTRSSSNACPPHRHLHLHLRLHYAARAAFHSRQHWCRQQRIASPYLQHNITLAFYGQTSYQLDAESAL